MTRAEPLPCKFNLVPLAAFGEMGSETNRCDRVIEDALMRPSRRFQWQYGILAHPTAPAASASCGLPMVEFMMHSAPVLTPRDLLALCTTNSLLWSRSGVFVGQLAAAQHGTQADAITSFKQLRELERVPRLYVLGYTLPMFLVENGVCLNSNLQKGRYRVSVTGWQNPDLGALDLWLDDVLVTDPVGPEWCGHEAAQRRALPVVEVEIMQTGRHVWRFTTSSRNMCFSEFRVECINKERSAWMVVWLRAVAHQAATAARTKFCHILSCSRWRPKLKGVTCSKRERRQRVQ